MSTSVSLSSVSPITTQNNKPKLSPGWGFTIFGNLPPYRYDHNSICTIACATFKELAETHFERDPTMPYLVGIVENESSTNNTKSANIYDLQQLKNWLVHSHFLNPITKKTCGRIYIYALDFFGNALSVGFFCDLNSLLEIANIEKVEDIPFYKELIEKEEVNLSNKLLLYYIHWVIIILNKFPLDSLPVQAQNKCLQLLSQIIVKKDEVLSFDAEYKLEKVVGSAEMNYIKGRAFIQANLHSVALEYLKKAILLNPDRIAYHSILFTIAKNLGFTEEVEKFYEFTICIHPYSFNSLRMLAFLQSSNDNFEKALESFSKSYELTKGTKEEVYDKFDIADILLKMGNVQRAEEIAFEILGTLKAGALILLTKLALIRKQYNHALSCLISIDYEKEPPGIKHRVDLLKLRLAEQTENLVEEGYLETSEQITIFIMESFPQYRGWGFLLLAQIAIKSGLYRLAKKDLEAVDNYSCLNSYRTTRKAAELKQKLEAIMKSN